MGGNISGTEYKCRWADELQAGKGKILKYNQREEMTLNFNTHFINNRQSK